MSRFARSGPGSRNLTGAGSEAMPDAAGRLPPIASTAREARGSRRVVVILIAATLLAGLALDHVIGKSASATGAPVPAGIPTIAAADSLSSTWFCPALQSSTGSDGRGRIIIANPTARVLSGTVTIVPSTGAPVLAKPVLQPYTRQTLKLETLAPGPYSAATVSFDQPGGAVEQEIQGSLGQSIAPCATSSSDHWYFAGGRTDLGDTMLISLYNPYPATAIADLTFATNTGPTTPDAFQGIVVPGGGFNVIDIGARVRSRTAVATSVNVRAGRLVADKVQIDSGAARGLALVLGASGAATKWYFPDGVVGSGVSEQFVVYNPGKQEADVQLAPALEQGGADPFPVTVPPEDTVTLDVGQQARIPPGIGEAWELSSLNSVPVAVERVITSTSPATHSGIGDTTGTPTLANRWVFPAGSAASGADEWLVVFNPTGRAAHVAVTVSGSGQPKALAGFTLAADSRRAVQISTEYPNGIVILDVTSDVPVAAERAQFVVGAPGLSDTIGIAGTTSVAGG